jgi:hypothetical protein
VQLIKVILKISTKLKQHCKSMLKQFVKLIRYEALHSRYNMSWSAYMNVYDDFNICYNFNE